MSDATVRDDVAAKKPSRLPLFIGLVLAVLGGAGGFYTAQSGLLDRLGIQGWFSERAEAQATTLPDVAFVSVPAIQVTLAPDSQARFLRFQADLEVPRRYQPEVAAMMPRILDVLNSYLRAVRPEDLTGPGALVRIRTHVLRRIQMVVGESRINDVLVIEFVIN